MNYYEFYEELKNITPVIGVYYDWVFICFLCTPHILNTQDLNLFYFRNFLRCSWVSDEQLGSEASHSSQQAFTPHNISRT